MRLMRPGSCVGPQQHFLYENQLEWVRWAAQDELRRELASQNGLAGRALAAAGAAAATTTSLAASAPVTVVASGVAVGASAPMTPPIRAGEDGEEVPTGAQTPGRDGATVPPVTPRRPPPGQPRKTPGRSRHAVAEPETAPESAGKTAAEVEEERMEGVVMSSPRKARTSTGAGAAAAAANDVKGKQKMLNRDLEEAGDDEGDQDDDPALLASPKKLDLGAATTAAAVPASPVASTRPKTPSASTRPTRIARPARPLSALADNRIVDRIGTSTITRASTRAGAGNAMGMARSKAAKDLNVVLETHATGTITAPGAAGSAGAQGRYSLRNGRTTSAGNVTTSPPVSQVGQPPNSPTKLPQSQRVLGKRDSVVTPPVSTGSTSSSNGTPGPGFDPAVAAAAAGAAGGKIVNGRNVRRRRSSMGGHETVNAG